MNSKAGCLIVFLLFQLIISKSFSQNLCPNPGFEQLTGCPAGAGEINLASPWTDAGNPSDLFSFCYTGTGTPSCNDVGVPLNFAGSSTAHAGSSYSGFYTKMAAADQRTYIQAPLNPFTTGQLYKVSAYFKRSTLSKFATNRIGITFSTNALSQTGNQFIPVTPQLEMNAVVADTGSWTLFTSYYAAFGGEKYITIGNFRNDVGTTSFNFGNSNPACNLLNTSAFYYVDDISITTVTEQISVTGDTIICVGQSTGLLGVTNTSGWWSSLSLPGDTIPSVNNLLTVTPTVTTSYLWHGFQTSYTVTVTVVSPPVVNLPADSTMCGGNNVTLDATCTGCSYLWSTGASTGQITVADSGSYIVSVDNGGCSARDTFKLSVINTPPIAFPDIHFICPDNRETVILNAGTGQSYLWNPGGDTSQSITVTLPGTYAVIVTHPGGCTRTAATEVSENCPELLFIPGAFTPNNDGKNELFYADGTNVKNYKIRIFNRWGQMVFESTVIGFEGGWNGKFDGKNATEGSYSFQIKYDALQPNGKYKPKTRSGNFVLIR